MDTNKEIEDLFIHWFNDMEGGKETTEMKNIWELIHNEFELISDTHSAPIDFFENGVFSELLDQYTLLASQKAFKEGYLLGLGGKENGK